MFQAVTIDGEDYWDGGYSVNPPLMPLIAQCTSRDTMLVQINPLKRYSTPQKPAEILDRIGELTFNAILLTQMRAIDFINTLLADGALDDAVAKQVLLHRVDGGEAMQEYPASSKSSTDAPMIRRLFEMGQSQTRHWLANHFDAIGERSTVDIRRDYLDDTRLEPAIATARRSILPRR